MVAKPTGLFINTLSMLSATIKNIKHGKLDHRFGLPILIMATIFAPPWATRVSSYQKSMSSGSSYYFSCTLAR
ncbi:hypothetical protein [Thermococcus sp. JCM 11816]|uniref:hypothetical protein n=1 Tax=Thermococcus sp. (strain JCM 11816 / KS-1) TaxID=1295125 RepID=UPI0034657D95